MTANRAAHPGLSRAARLSAAALLGLALGGCAALEAMWAPPAAEAPAPPAEAAPAPAAEAEPALPPPPRRRPVRSARLAPPAERAAPAAPEPAPELRIVGLSRMEAVELIGWPSEVREAAPAKVWQFRAGDCAVDVYFYLDVARNDFYALHYGVQGQAPQAGSPSSTEAADRCLQRIHSENRR